MRVRMKARQAAVMAAWAVAWAGSKPIASLADGGLAGLIGVKADRHAACAARSVARSRLDLLSDHGKTVTGRPPLWIADAEGHVRTRSSEDHRHRLSPTGRETCQLTLR